MILEMNDIKLSKFINKMFETFNLTDVASVEITKSGVVYTLLFKNSALVSIMQVQVKESIIF